MLPLEISGARLLLRRSQPRSGIFNPDAEGSLMLDLEVGLHVFMTVLVLGTLWRVLQYHLMASPNPGIQHIGKAMSTQY